MFGTLSALNRLMLNLVILFSLHVLAFDNSVERNPMIVSFKKKQILVRTIYDSTQMTFQNCPFDPNVTKSADQIRNFISQPDLECSTVSLSIDITTPSDITKFENELFLKLKKALRLYTVAFNLEDLTVYGASGLFAGTLVRQLSIIMTEKGTVPPYLVASVGGPVLAYGAYKLIRDNIDFYKAKQRIKIISAGLQQGHWPLVESDLLHQLFASAAQQLMIQKQGFFNTHSPALRKTVE